MQAEQHFAELPLVAILRGLVPEQAIEVASALYESGIRIIEVPLNSPEPFRSIQMLAGLSHLDWSIGAGTVLNVDDVERTLAAGGTIIISPNCNTEVIRRALDRGLEPIPGVATATEACVAIDAGAHYLKLFPAITYGPAHLRALSSVLPSHIRVIPVGGIGAGDMADWIAAGAAGFGFGSELFKPGYSLEDVAQRGRRLVGALREALGTDAP
jgi:2-dehydro-3-deoxyphosphogalactonate aldolase